MRPGSQPEQNFYRCSEINKKKYDGDLNQDTGILREIAYLGVCSKIPFNN